MPRKSESDTFAAALTEVSDNLSRLVHDEIELAKTEMIQKASSLARGAAAVAAGAVFGVFAVVFFLLTLAWVFDGIFVSGAGSLWLGFLIVLVILLVLTVGAFLFAWRKLKVGAPTPNLAISEGKKIKDTVTSFGTGYTPSGEAGRLDAGGRTPIPAATAPAPAASVATPPVVPPNPDAVPAPVSRPATSWVPADDAAPAPPAAAPAGTPAGSQMPPAASGATFVTQPDAGVPAASSSTPADGSEHPTVSQPAYEVKPADAADDPQPEN